MNFIKVKQRIRVFVISVMAFIWSSAVIKIAFDSRIALNTGSDKQILFDTRFLLDSRGELFYFVFSIISLLAFLGLTVFKKVSKSTGLLIIISNTIFMILSVIPLLINQ